MILPNPSLGIIEYQSVENFDSFEISNSEISIEKINGEKIIYISATASHHEIHGVSKVYIEDLNFSLLMPFPYENLNENLTIEFPKSDSNHPFWEKNIHSSFYRFEHLIILNSTIQIEKENRIFNIRIKGEIGEGLESNFRYLFNTKFKAELKNRINRKKNYFLND